MEKLSPVLEGIKEPVRIILMSLVSYFLTEGVLNNLLVVVFGTRLDQATTYLLTGILTTILRGVEKAYYVEGKETGEMNRVSQVLKFE